MSVEVDFLARHSHCAQQVAEWLFHEFVQIQKPGLSLRDIEDKVELSLNEGKLPIRLVALRDGQCIGTAALLVNDLRCCSYTPWLGGLYVDPACRGAGTAKLLIERVKELAGELGYSELYLRTEHTAEYYRSLGWGFVEQCIDEYGQDTQVFRWVL